LIISFKFKLKVVKFESSWLFESSLIFLFMAGSKKIQKVLGLNYYVVLIGHTKN